MANTVGMAIVGAGRIFEQHARAYAALGGRTRLLGIADVDEAQLLKATSRYFIPYACRDYRALLERDDVDVVTVCTPPALHEQVVVDALEAGKFVLCEKPLAHTLAAADRILAVARRWPGKLSTVYQFRYLPEVQRTVWLRDQGRLGRLMSGRFSRYARFETPAKAGKRGKAPKPGKVRTDWWGRWGTAGGGAVMTQLIHEIDLMCHLFGPAVAITADMDTLKESIESEDTCAATVRFASGAVVCCFGTMTAHRSSNAFDVFGELGSVHSPWALECMDTRWRDESMRAVLAAHPLSAEDSSPRPGLRAALRARLWGGGAHTAPPVSAHTPYVADVLDAIADGRPLPIGGDEARASLEICTAIYASALARQPIALPLDSTNRCYGGVTTDDYDGRSRHRLETSGTGPVRLVSGSGR
jgi:UDP-N-acetyl-2-amino-2-deoxyglucuronate dehydrogenase